MASNVANTLTLTISLLAMSESPSASNKKPRFRDKFRKVKDKFKQVEDKFDSLLPNSRSSSPALRPADQARLTTDGPSARSTAISADSDVQFTATVAGPNVLSTAIVAGPAVLSTAIVANSDVPSTATMVNRPPSRPPANITEGEEQTTRKDRLRVVLNVLSQVLNAAAAAMAVFPPAQAVIGGVASGVKMAKVCLNLVFVFEKDADLPFAVNGSESNRSRSSREEFKRSPKEDPQV